MQIRFRMYALFGVLGGIAACNMKDEAYVECKSAGALLNSGLACTIEHRKGSSALHACWDFNIKCQNGASGTAHGCGDVEPQTKSMVSIPFSAFGGKLDKCDAIGTANVSGMTLTRK